MTRHRAEIRMLDKCIGSMLNRCLQQFLIGWTLGERGAGQSSKHRCVEHNPLSSPSAAVQQLSSRGCPNTAQLLRQLDNGQSPGIPGDRDPAIGGMLNVIGEEGGVIFDHCDI